MTRELLLASGVSGDNDEIFVAKKKMAKIMKMLQVAKFTIFASLKG
jgi:hypothetical protein